MAFHDFFLEFCVQVIIIYWEIIIWGFLNLWLSDIEVMIYSVLPVKFGYKISLCLVTMVIRSFFKTAFFPLLFF